MTTSLEMRLTFMVDFCTNGVYKDRITSTKGQKITVPDVGTKPFARMHGAFGFLVSKENVVLRRRESETKI